MPDLIKKNWILTAIILLATFFYIFRLQQTFVMAGDSSRDLMDVMNIWQNKIITVVGEPVNTISNNPTQILFGSLYLYLGLFGLIVSNFNPAGSVIADIALTLISIPFFFLLAESILKKKNVALLSTFIYALSPITVTLTRSYWEPNIVIPISVFAWFFFFYKPSSIKFFFAGLVSGIVFDIHYMNIIPIALYILLLFFKKNKKAAILTVAGFFVAISPLITFEIKNHFFLTKAFMGTLGGFSTFSERTLNPFLSMDIFLYIFGLGPYQYFVPALINMDFAFRIAVDGILGIIFFYFLLRKQKLFHFDLICVLIAGLLAGWYFERWHLIGLRYILSVFPLFIISFVALLDSLNVYLILLPLIPMIILSVKIITYKLDPAQKTDYYPLPIVEEISKAIIDDKPTGRYNVTENILGDARSLAFRFYLLRDAEIKPQPVENYDRIETLYVITPSLDRTYKEGRWEFSASGPKKIAWVKDFGELKLFKFTK
jgi:hypothetical protein